MYIINLDYDKCTNCGECTTVCPVEIFKRENDKTIVGPSDDCSYCQSCISVCAAEAITISEL